MNFQGFNFDPRIVAGITAQGYTEPTPIQLQAIPPILDGRDVLGLAQTGTGKTAAFVLPILQRLLKTAPTPGSRPIRALILAPTRELAEQTHQTIGVLGASSGLRSAVIYGGVGHASQVAALRRGVDIVVACPGRLLDHIDQGSIKLATVTMFVLDEADQMFDMGFWPDVQRVLRQLPEMRQNLLFSATMPDHIRKIAQKVLRRPVTVEVGHDAPVETVTHALYPVAQHLKTQLLMELLNKTATGGPVLVFTRTKHRARRVGELLAQANFSSASLHGNLAQARRQAVLDGFRDGSYSVLVATDIAARGIDVTGVSHVINYDMPSTAELYTHRIGRTGRAARTGAAFTLTAPEDSAMVTQIERILGAPVERRTLSDFDYAAAAPRKNTEFAREPQPRRNASALANAKRADSSAKARVHRLAAP